MATQHAPSVPKLSPRFFAEVEYLLRRVVVHGEEQEMLFRVVETARALATTPVQSCVCECR